MSSAANRTPRPDGAVTFTPTLAMRAAARRGLALRERFGRGGTIIGVTRAHQLARRQPLSLATVRRMHSFFARHAVDSLAPGFWDRARPSAGRIAWLLWGGDAGRRWARRIAERSAGRRP